LGGEHLGTLTTIFDHILNIASAQGTKQEQNYGAKQNAGSRIGAADTLPYSFIGQVNGETALI